MAEQAPPPPPPPPPPADAPTTAAAPEPARRSRKGPVLGGIAVAAVLGIGYGAYAIWDKLDGGGPQPHDVLPASTQLYARVDLDPSAGQKIALFKLIRKFPDVAEEIGIRDEDQDIRQLVFDEALKGCDGLDYEDDVKPWLGDRVGIGAELQDERFVIAVQTKDEKKSREGIKKLFGCGGEGYGIAYLDGYAILAPKQADVDASVTAAKKASLGDSKRFSDDFDELGGEGIASAWVDVASVADTPEAKQMFGPQLDELVAAGSVATTLRVDGNALELAALGGGTQQGDTDAVSLASLPSDTVLALSLAGVGDQVGEAFDAFVQSFDELAASFTGSTAGIAERATAGSAVPYSSSPPDTAQDLIDQIERSSGFRLPEDLETLFGDRLTLAVGAKNLEALPTLSGPEGLSSLDVALALDSDRTKALALVQRIVSLGRDAGIPLVAQPTDDGAVLATNQDAATSITDADGSLGDEKAFQEVVPDGDAAYGGFYLNIGAILDKLLEADPPEGVRSVIEEAKALSAVGVSVTEEDGDRSLVRLRVSFN
ncbi:DUF3352 domain-containing protein [Aeromicrobium chenweiae]|uniref:Uncharacterized protein n=1 Tax=Aeromicrobium chenweiae TaxID=2079793 RepID=A0A2S0WRD6_9ACTN|nr:DUF3352 domain-containing protein [Aeromicrobium chenweiae]AWB93860.1 hypothetical protein C3E78_17495 [Aeromicrobium chenweiae]TGN30905.1 DUF3352 domain-containing protein [Aeromicrobium chenweiae]